MGGVGGVWGGVGGWGIEGSHIHRLVGSIS